MPQDALRNWLSKKDFGQDQVGEILDPEPIDKGMLQTDVMIGEMVGLCWIVRTDSGLRRSPLMDSGEEAPTIAAPFVGCEIQLPHSQIKRFWKTRRTIDRYFFRPKPIPKRCSRATPPSPGR